MMGILGTRESQRMAAAIAGRWLLSLIFLLSGAQTVLDFHSTAADLAEKHVPIAGVILGLAVTAELGGAILLITGLRYRWGALLLLFFLIPVTFMYHAFWQYDGPRRDAQKVHFLKNLAIAGGLLLTLTGTQKTGSAPERHDDGRPKQLPK
jgi:putative oxidoreductase